MLPPTHLSPTVKKQFSSCLEKTQEPYQQPTPTSNRGIAFLLFFLPGHTSETLWPGGLLDAKQYLTVSKQYLPHLDVKGESETQGNGSFSKELPGASSDTYTLDLGVASGFLKEAETVECLPVSLATTAVSYQKHEATSLTAGPVLKFTGGACLDGILPRCFLTLADFDL